MTSLLSRIVSLPTNLFHHGKRHPKKSVGAAIAVAVILALVIMFGGSAEEATVVEVLTPSVKVASVAALSQDTEPLILLGEVRSVTQAELRAQKSGKMTRVNVRAGQFVGAGTILAEIENNAERAAVLSAQGALAAAEANLTKVVTGARGEDKASATAQTASAVTTLQTAEEGARNAYSQSYSLAADAIFAQADDFFTGVYTVDPRFRVRTATFDEKQILESERLAIGTLLEAWKIETLTQIDAAVLDSKLAEATANLERIKAFLNRISTFVSEQEVGTDLTTTEKAAQEASILGARTSIDSARTAVAGARSGLAGARSAQRISSLSESKIVVGARIEDVQAAEAAVTQAQGALAGAFAILENSLIRTPISGTVSTLNVARGDFVSVQQSIAVVANPGVLEIEAFVSGTALDRVRVDMPVLVAGSLTGKVTSRAPGLDPITKKARVTVSAPDDTGIVNGSFVELALMENGTEETVTLDEFMIPITAVKVLPKGFALFTVTPDGVLEAIPITEGPIIGSRMLVKDSLSQNLQIVVDVRGFKEGDEVEVIAN